MDNTLHTKYRPVTFEEISGQRETKSILLHQLATGEFKNAYLFVGPAGCGKAQPLDSLIYTPEGPIQMGDVKIGDTILDGKGEPTVVTGVYPQGVRDIYRITFNDRTSINVSDEHINRVYRYNQDKKKKEYFDLTTIELIKLFNNSRFSLRVDVPIVHGFSEKPVLIDPYLLGFLIGDGSLSSGNCGFSNSEEDIIEKITNKVNSIDHHLVKVNDVDYNIVNNKSGINQFTTNTNSLRQNIKYYGLDCISVEKHIPEEYLYNSYEVRLELLRGLFDSDGFVGSNGSVVFSTSSPKLSEDLSILVRSLGIRDTVSVAPTSYTKPDGTKIDCHEAYSHYLKVPNNLVIATSKKHLSRLTVRQTEPIRKIVKIEKIEPQECQCIMVASEDHTYLTDNLTPTHNTTSARAFARAINGGAGGVIEVNASSNNSVDDMRNLLEASKFKAIDAEYKVIVLDEVHALSNAAFQAFLKDLEEPAKKTIWILCTTEVQKIPATILSRVQRFDFKRIGHDDVVDRLKYIVDKENEEIVLSKGGSQDALHDPGWAEREGIELIEVSDEAYDYMAKLGNGGMRASIAILDKVLGYTKKVDVDAVVKAVGTSLPEQMLKLYRMLEDRNYKGVIEAVDEIYLSGKDLRLFTADFISFVLDLSKYAITGDINLTSLPASIESDLYSDEDSDFALDLLDSLVDLGQQIKYSENPKALVESTLLLVSRG